MKAEQFPYLFTDYVFCTLLKLAVIMFLLQAFYFAAGLGEEMQRHFSTYAQKNIYCFQPDDIYFFRNY